MRYSLDSYSLTTHVDLNDCIIDRNLRSLSTLVLKALYQCCIMEGADLKGMKNTDDSATCREMRATTNEIEWRITTWCPRENDESLMRITQ